ncbi:MAG: TIGR00725 family protein [Thermodesulfovibrionales bacterium]
MRPPLIAVIGGRRASRPLLQEAEKAGRLIAAQGATLLCGGLGGIMEAASKGAAEEGGLTVGILPHDSGTSANPHISVAIATGMGIGRNVIIARSADAVIAIGGAYGTLSEIAFALQLEKPVIGIRTWDIKGVEAAQGAEDAVARAFRALA